MPAIISTRRASVPTPPSAPLRLIGLSEVCRKTGYSRWWVRSAVNERTFPTPVGTGGRSTRFVEHEIDQWIMERIAERDAGRRA